MAIDTEKQDQFLPKVIHHGKMACLKFICRFPFPIGQFHPIIKYQRWDIHDDKCLANIISASRNFPLNMEIYVEKKFVYEVRWLCLVLCLSRSCWFKVLIIHPHEVPLQSHGSNQSQDLTNRLLMEYMGMLITVRVPILGPRFLPIGRLKAPPKSLVKVQPRLQWTSTIITPHNN